MKKFLFVLAISAFVACNDTTEGGAPTGDSTSTVDTSTTMSPVDTTTLPSDTTRIDSAK